VEVVRAVKRQNWGGADVRRFLLPRKGGPKIDR
jgi:hypothetical protein